MILGSFSCQLTISFTSSSIGHNELQTLHEIRAELVVHLQPWNLPEQMRVSMIVIMLHRHAAKEPLGTSRMGVRFNVTYSLAWSSSTISNPSSRRMSAPHVTRYVGGNWAMFGDNKILNDGSRGSCPFASAQSSKLRRIKNGIAQGQT